MRTWCLQVAGTRGSHIAISFRVFSLLFCLSVGVFAVSLGVFGCCGVWLVLFLYFRCYYCVCVLVGRVILFGC